MTFRAHFDGRVLVPEEPLDLPANVPVQVEVRVVKQKKVRSFRLKNGFPLARNDGIRMTAKDVASTLHDE